MFPRIISSAARLKACSFNMVIPKIHSSSILIFLDLESHSHSREKIQFFETRLRIIFLALTWRDESRLLYEHSRISRRERDYILLFSCFETRSRLKKIISRGRARKDEADSRREFPGSRILADLWLTLINESYILQKN